MRKKTLVSVLIFATIGVVVLAGAGWLFYAGVLHVNNPSPARYPVRGVDVSSYQGDVDWKTLAGQDIRFAFIKATEGSQHVDRQFAANYEGARQAGVRVGAYHFFSYDSSGENQAAHFIATVPAATDNLPPVVDVEFYGAYGKQPKSREDVKPELDAFLAAVEAHYGKKPIIYATMESYERYIKGDYPYNMLWIRDIWGEPKLAGRDWVFWQYSNRHRLEGYSGPETFIDMNVFYGDSEAFDSVFCLSTICERK